MASKRFDESMLATLREQSVSDTVAMIGLYAKIDPDFQPTKKNPYTKRLYISVGNSVTELIVTGSKWFDTRMNKGGYGGIDLTMHLFKEPFADAVNRLVTTSIENDSPDCAM